jgi:hypothetical protein
VSSDETNIVRFKRLLSARKITNQFVFNIVARAVIFARLVGWHATSRASPHFGITARRVTSSVVDRDGEFEKSSVHAYSGN